MDCCSFVKSDKYKWVILVLVCFVQMLRAGFISGTLSLFSIYYTDRYDDRQLSSNIGSIQLSVANLAALPAVLLNKKITERWTQVIGGVLTAAGMAGTAFTQQAWQGILANGAITGLGSAFTNAATYSVLGKYFPGRQLAPYAAITVCQNVGVMVTPQIVGETMKMMGFTFTFILCGSVMSLSLFCGLLFATKEKVTDTEVEGDKPKEVKRSRASSVTTAVTLKFKGNKQGIYRLPQIFEHDQEIGDGKYNQLSENSSSDSTSQSDTSSELSSELSSGQSTPYLTPNSSYSDLSLVKHTMKKSSSLAFIMQNVNAQKQDTDSIKIGEEKEQPHNKEKNSTLFNVISAELGTGVAGMLDESAIKKPTIKDVFKTPAAVNFLVTVFITTGGIIAYNSIIGDYCRMELGYTNAEFVFGLTVLGIAQLITGIIYMVVAKFASFSSSFMFVCAGAGSAGITFMFMSCPNVDNFYVLMAFLGLFKALYINCVFGAGMEVTSPALAIVMFMITTFCEGVGGIVFPYLSSYLQIEVNARAGLYTAGGVQLLGALSLLPLSIRYLITPKNYSKPCDNAFCEDIQQTAHISHRVF